MLETLALAAATGGAIVIALVMGEYQLTLGTAVAAGLIVGFLLAEIVLSVARWRGVVPAVATALLAGGSLVWAAWIETGRGVAPMPEEGWLAAVLAAAVAALRLRPRAPTST